MYHGDRPNDCTYCSSSCAFARQLMTLGRNALHVLETAGMRQFSGCQALTKAANLIKPAISNECKVQWPPSVSEGTNVQSS
jgi:hypothetical protein